MATGYPDGTTPGMQDAAHGSYSIDEENERRRVAKMLAEQDWDDVMTTVPIFSVNSGVEDAKDFIVSNAGDYILGIVLGGDYYHAAMRDLRRDCIACLAEDMDPARINQEMGTCR